MSVNATDQKRDDSLDFDIAFDESMSPDPVVEKTEATTIDEKSKEVPEPEVAVTQDAGGTEESDTEASEGEPETAEVRRESAPEEASAKPDTTLLDKLAALEAKLADYQKPKPELEVKKEPEPEPEVLDAAEKEAIKSMAEEWPELTSGFKAQLKLERVAIEKMVKDAIRDVMTQLRPAMQTAESVAQNAFLDALARFHPDAEQIYPQVAAWVTTLKPAFTKAYREVLDFGTADEVAEVFDLYKKVNGVAMPAKTVKQPSPEKKDKLTQMSSVRRERTGVSAEIDKDDFGAAFQRAAES